MWGQYEWLATLRPGMDNWNVRFSEVTRTYGRVVPANRSAGASSIHSVHRLVGILVRLQCISCSPTPNPPRESDTRQMALEHMCVAAERQLIAERMLARAEAAGNQLRMERAHVDRRRAATASLRARRLARPRRVWSAFAEPVLGISLGVKTLIQ
jgi:hypothetical protein